jgi:hypothetical protein
MSAAILYLQKVGDYVPQFDLSRAVRSITNAATFTELEVVWFSVALDYEMSDRLVPRQVHEAYEWQRAMIDELQRMVAGEQ